MQKIIFITGGGGYCRSLLVPTLLDLGHQITVYDVMFFTDNFLPKNNKNLKIVTKTVQKSTYNNTAFSLKITSWVNG